MSDSLKNWTWEGKHSPGRSQAFSPSPMEAIRKKFKHSGPPVSLSCRQEVNKYVVGREMGKKEKWRETVERG